jgi:guanylate kinase
VLSGPSGVGKGSVVAAVRRRHPQVWLSVSVTTRPPRPGETDGVEYHFVSPERFSQLAGAGELLEWATYAGNSYGTPAGPLRDRLRAGVPSLLEIGLQGARQVRRSDPTARLVFLSPPSVEELARRLAGRGTEDDETRSRRLAVARQEMAALPEFDHVVVNDDVEAAADRLVALLIDPAGDPPPAAPS